MTNRKQTEVLLRELRENKNVSDETILDWILNNYLEGSQSVEALQLFEMEYFDEIFEDDDDQDIDDYDMSYDEEEDD